MAVLGWLLVLIPFLAIFGFIAWETDIVEALVCFGAAALFVGMVILGLSLAGL